MTKRFERSIETGLLISVLNEATTESPMITYAKLSQAAGVDVQNEGNGFLQSARRAVERDFNKFFITVRGEGLKLATEREQADCGMGHIDKSRRSARRGRKIIQSTNLSALDNETKTKALAAASILGAIEMFGKETTKRKIEGAAGERKDYLPAGDVLKQMMK